MSNGGDALGSEHRSLELALAAVGKGDLEGAIRVSGAALANGSSNPLFFKLRAIGYERQGRLDQAIGDFRAALNVAPRDFAALSALGLCLARVGQFGEALAALDASISIEPRYSPAHANRGWTLDAQGDRRGARAAFEKALEIDPSNLLALGGSAVIAARSGAADVAETYAARALAIAAGDIQSNLARSMAELARNETQPAIDRLKRLLANAGLPQHERGVALSLLGDAFDADGCFEQAFEAYTSSNAALATVHGGQASAERAGDLVRRLTVAFETAEPKDWRRGPPSRTASPFKAHLFIVGFPRSGTTLAGQILAAHPQTVVLDEQDNLADPARRFLADPDGLEALKRLSEDEREGFRTAYYRQVLGGTGADGRVFVDKLPMNVVGLPLINQLFPEARVLLLRRDPRDVVLSCYRRQFAVSGLSREFLELEGAAGFYDAVMRLTELYLDKLELDVRVQRYEDLVADFAGQTRAICDFAGIDWTPELTGFAAASQAVEVATPSAGQVRKGLYGKAVGHWRNYFRQLEPVLPRLAEWVDRYGYDPDRSGDHLPGSTQEGADAQNAAAALLAEARRLAQADEIAGALEAARQAAGLDPENAEAFVYWGVSAAELGLFAEALDPLKIAAERATPGTIGWANVTSQLARALSNVGFWLRAYRAADSIDRAPPPDALIRHRIGAVFERIGLVHRALPHLEWAAKAAPDKPQTLFNLGVAKLSLGQADAAEALLEQAIAVEPLWTPPHMALASVRRWSAERSHVDRLRELRSRPELDSADRAEIGFSLFKELDDLKRYDEAWPVLQDANEGARDTETLWSAEEDRALIDAIIARFPKHLFESAPIAAGPAGRRQPLFVVGLPRSGTTLVERILAAHPEVEAIGEAPSFPILFRSASTAADRRDLTADVVSRTGNANWPRLAQAYLSETSYFPGDRRFLVDKLPLNSLLIGAIKLAFPRSPIVLLRREPMDGLFSAYRVQFAGVYRWAYRLEDLAEHYANHRWLMDHWRDCLGEGLIDISYEELARHPEREARRMLAACGLEFDPRCLKPHETSGPVRTASITQIRSPISSAGIGGWRRYERQLEPLRARLDALGVLGAG